MTPEKKIERLIKKINVTPSARMHTKTLNDALAAQEKWKQEQSTNLKPNIWRIIMKNPMTKLAAAAVIVIAVLIGVNQFTGSIDGASVAWGNIVTRVSHVDYVHFYNLECDDNGFKGTYEGWYARGKTVRRGDSGYTYYDDGQLVQGFDRHKTRTVKYPSSRTVKHPSFWVSGKSFFEKMSRSFLSTDNEQFTQQMPANVGDDFLIYTFDPPPEDSEWLESISIAVGKNSLLPIQVKFYCTSLEGREAGYFMTIFDYEAPEKPPEFFEPPTVGESPHGKGQIVLDGQEVMIDISGAPGIKTAIVCLYDKYEGPGDDLPIPTRMRYEMDGGPVFHLDVTFITEEGFRSITNDSIIVWLNEGMKCGLGADNWPDGKYRNIRFTPVLRPTDQEAVYIIEISCWLRTK